METINLFDPKDAIPVAFNALVPTDPQEAMEEGVRLEFDTKPDYALLDLNTCTLVMALVGGNRKSHLAIRDWTGRKRGKRPPFLRWLWVFVPHAKQEGTFHAFAMADLATDAETVHKAADAIRAVYDGTPATKDLFFASLARVEAQCVAAAEAWAKEQDEKGG